MKTLFAFILGIAVGAVALHWYRQNPASTPVERGPAPAGNVTTSLREGADSAMAKTRAAASDFSDAFGQKMREWKLTPDDIRADLGKTGSVVRENAARAKDKVADVRIVAVIKAKFVLDRELAATALSVDSNDGRVTLSGTVESEALVGQAVAHAMDTDGVVKVDARIAVRRAGTP